MRGWGSGSGHRGEAVVDAACALSSRCVSLLIRSCRSRTTAATGGGVVPTPPDTRRTRWMLT